MYPKYKLRGGHEYAPELCVYSITSGGCSCDLVTIGTAAEAIEKKTSKLLSIYKKKGWSQAKIDRALKDRIEVSQARSALRADVIDFLDRQLTKQNHIELILHWHSGEFETEKFDLSGIENCDVHGRFQISELQENICYVFKKISNR